MPDYFSWFASWFAAKTLPEAAGWYESYVMPRQTCNIILS